MIKPIILALAILSFTNQFAWEANSGHTTNLHPVIVNRDILSVNTPKGQFMIPESVRRAFIPNTSARSIMKNIFGLCFYLQKTAGLTQANCLESIREVPQSHTNLVKIVLYERGHKDWARSVQEIFDKRLTGRMLNRGLFDANLKTSLLSNVGQVVDAQIKKSTEANIESSWRASGISEKIDNLIDEKFGESEVLDTEDEIFDKIDSGAKGNSEQVFERKLQKLAPKLKEEIMHNLEKDIEKSEAQVVQRVKTELQGGGQAQIISAAKPQVEFIEDKLQEEKNETAGSPDQEIENQNKTINEDVEAEVNRRLKLMSDSKIKAEFERRVRETLAKKLGRQIKDIAEIDTDIEVDNLRDSQETSI